MSNDFPPGSHRITLDRALEMTARYKANMDIIISPDMANQNILAICETFRKDELIAYLSQDFVYSIRIYYGMSEDLQIHAIVLGADKDGNDILPIQPNHLHPPGDGEDGELFEDAVRCPTYCPPPGWPRLNSKD